MTNDPHGRRSFTQFKENTRDELLHGSFSFLPSQVFPFPKKKSPPFFDHVLVCFRLFDQKYDVPNKMMRSGFWRRKGSEGSLACNFGRGYAKKERSTLVKSLVWRPGRRFCAKWSCCLSHNSCSYHRNLWQNNNRSRSLIGSQFASTRQINRGCPYKGGLFSLQNNHPFQKSSFSGGVHLGGTVVID